MCTNFNLHITKMIEAIKLHFHYWYLKFILTVSHFISFQSFDPMTCARRSLYVPDQELEDIKGVFPAVIYRG